MDDAQFLAAFESAAIPNAAFRHHAHLRMAWLYVRRDGPEVGAARIREGIQRFAAAHGLPHLYHETVTGFWTRLMAHAVDAFPELDRAPVTGWERRRSRDVVEGEALWPIA